MDSRVEVVAQTRDALGETPVWLPASRCVAWIDALQCRVHRYHPDTAALRTLTVDLPAPLGGIVRTADEDQLVLATPGAVGLLDLAHNRFTTLHALDAQRDDIVCNDAKVDRHGALWVGTCERPETAPRGALYRIAPGAEPLLFDAGFVVPNGPAFSPSGTTVYVSDTMSGRILAYTVDEQGRQAGPRLVFADLATCGGGLPDGLTVDDQGNLWCGLWSGGGIVCFAPDGRMRERIGLPATNVTSLAFGGVDHGDLYVTSARTGLDEDTLRSEPLAGSLFRVRTGARGLPEPVWNARAARSAPMAPIQDP